MLHFVKGKDYSDYGESFLSDVSLIPSVDILRYRGEKMTLTM